jgi:hypothetical protein
VIFEELQEQQKRQMLDVIAVREAVIPQDAAIIPKFLAAGV